MMRNYQTIRFHETSNLHVTPDLIMIGVPDIKSGGVFLFASTEMGRATLTAHAMQTVKDIDSLLFSNDRPLNTTYRLSVEMFHFVMAFGQTYQEALRLLMNDWNPDDKSPPREIEG